MANNRWNDKKSQYEIGTVTLRTVDQAITDYFAKKLNLTVDNGEAARTQVKVVFAGAERWKAIQNDNGLRDEHGTLILPLLAIRRTNIQREKRGAGMASEQPYITVKRKVADAKTELFANLQAQRSKNGFPSLPQGTKIYEHWTIPFPDFCTMQYEVQIWPQYQQKMNEIIEQMVYAYDYSDSFVCPVNYGESKTGNKGFYFVAFNDGDFNTQSNYEDMTDEERMVKYSINLRVPVYLILNPNSSPTAYGFDKGNPDSVNAPMVYKQEGAAQITVSEKVINPMAPRRN